MSSVLIIGDTMRNPEMRHEVPIGIPDPFLYAELDGRRIVAISSMEAIRVEGLGTGLEVHTFEEYGADELRRSSVTGIRSCGAHRPGRPGARDREGNGAGQVPGPPQRTRFARRASSSSSTRSISTTAAAGSAGTSSTGSGARRRPPRPGVATARELLAPGGALERRSEARRQAADVRAAEGARPGGRSSRHGAIAEEMILSHGPQTAVGHDMGSGQIARRRRRHARPLPGRPGVGLLRRPDPHGRRRRRRRGAQSGTRSAGRRWTSQRGGPARARTAPRSTGSSRSSSPTAASRRT